MTTTREARLKPEFGSLYPGIAPGVWIPARLLADQVATAFGRLTPGDEGPRRRELNDTHFEFRTVDAPVNGSVGA